MLRTLVVLLAVCFISPAFASDQLLRKNRCVNCHALDRKNVGPSFKDVAAKYKADREAEMKLVKKVLEGGKGSWGTITMPARGGFPDVPDSDVQPMVKYILSL